MLPLLCSAPRDQWGTVIAHIRTHSASVFCFFTATLLLMAYSFTSLRSLENNEGVCCINLCNGEREGVWDGGGGSEAGGGEEQSDELMLHCSSSVHTLHLVLF